MFATQPIICPACGMACGQGCGGVASAQLSAMPRPETALPAVPVAQTTPAPTDEAQPLENWLVTDLTPDVWTASTATWGLEPRQPETDSMGRPLE